MDTPPPCAQIAYGSTGTATSLLPDVDYWWTVTVAPVGGGAPVTTPPEPFSTALAAWQATWVTGYSQFRGSFVLAPPAVARARLYVTGVGCYVAYVNGVQVSSLLAPGMSTTYNVRLLTQTIDVAAYLVPGENVLAFRTGTCKYGYLGEYCIGSPTDTCQGVIAQLSITDAAGNNTVVGTSGSGGLGVTWLGTAARNPIVYQHLYHGEVFDARLDDPGWAGPGFTPAPGTYAPMAAYTPAVALLVPQTMPVITVDRTVTPTRVWQAPNTTAAPQWVLDYGINMAGICNLNLSSLAAAAAAVYGAGVVPRGLNVTYELAEITSGPAPNSTIINTFLVRRPSRAWHAGWGGGGLLPVLSAAPPPPPWCSTASRTRAAAPTRPSPTSLPAPRGRAAACRPSTRLTSRTAASGTRC
jgi:hypothetical protein